MIRYVIVGMILCANASLHAATIQAVAPHSQAIGIVNGPLILTNSTNSAPVQPNNISVVVKAPDTSKLNVLQRHQDALLLAQNPTKIELVDAKFMHWAGDAEEYLGLVFRNVSSLPAYRFDFGNVDPKNVGKNIKNLRLLKFAPSSSEPQNVKINYQIDAGKDRVVPFIGISELRRVLDVRPEYCVVLARTAENATNFPFLPVKPGFSHALELHLPVMFTYWSIFDQQVLVNSVISIVVTQRDMLLPPGPNRKDSDIRCHDGPSISSIEEG